MKKDTLWNRYFVSLWGGLPNDLCSYFHTSLISILLLPFTILYAMFEWPLTYQVEQNEFRFRKNIIPVIGTVIVHFCIYILSVLVGKISVEELGFDLIRGVFLHALLALVAGILSLAVILAIFFGIVALFTELIGPWFSSLKGPKIKQPSFVSTTGEVIKAWKGKYCPRINWK